MSFMELVQHRRSVRNYAERPIEREKLNRCLEAARLAPSACNSQPWSFVVVTSPELRRQLVDGCFSGMYRMNQFAAQAAALAVLVREKSRYAARLGGALRRVEYSLIDVGIAGEHFVLQAAEEGLGTCWLGWFNERVAKKVLGMPRSVRIDSIISVGYPTADAPAVPVKRMALDQMSSYRE